MNSHGSYLLTSITINLLPILFSLFPYCSNFFFFFFLPESILKLIADILHLEVLAYASLKVIYLSVYIVQIITMVVSLSVGNLACLHTFGVHEMPHSILPPCHFSSEGPGCHVELYYSYSDI